MSAREWAAGTVAVIRVRYNAGDVRAWFDGYEWHYKDADGDDCLCREPSHVRPLIAIDPNFASDDLPRLLRKAASGGFTPTSMNADAVRRLADHIERETRWRNRPEPKDRFAVVIDKAGDGWALSDDGLWRCLADGDSRALPYEHIHVARVLSEGVGRAPEDEEGA